MSTTERVFHAVLFEVLATILIVIGLTIFTNHTIEILSGTMIVVATVAMIWNFALNSVIDRYFNTPREFRTFGFRVFHVFLFEGGLLLLTVPLMARLLSVRLTSAFMMDIGATIFITIYGFVFNFVYDKTRVLLLRN